ncbi:MAG TPA: glycoside hydrolase family 3 N-terminal domain-containing protein [Candidatus Acidoferrales bacterium]|nr:glycoside hydrolase family 3 N-terminal domain-containing protein [Candidatus Acidoferrales bacterium]
MRKTTTLFVAHFVLACATETFSQTLPYQDTTLTIQQRVDDLIGRMTLDEKVGQMVLMNYSDIATPSDIASCYIGAVLATADTGPADKTPQAWADLHDSLQAYALQTRLKIPILFGIDAVHGFGAMYGATVFPHNIGMGCTRDTDLVAQEEQTTAAEMKATGIDWTFAPVVAVARDARWGRTYESFGEDPDLVKGMAAAAVRGFQGDTSAKYVDVLACAKHFIGDGGTTGGVTNGNTLCDDQTLREIHLPGYLSAINQKVGSIMIAQNQWNGIHINGYPFLEDSLLKIELGFNGLTVSDFNSFLYAGDPTVPYPSQILYGAAIAHSINAGEDMAMMSVFIGFNHRTYIDTIKSLINKGVIPIERIDDAVKRILSQKFRLGLFEHPYADKTLISSVGSSAHRAIARQGVRESVVLLKKKDGILPFLKTGKRILVAGASANDLGYQCGGWTMSWQGASGNITVGTTILQGMQAAAPGDSIVFSKTGNFADTSADYSVVVVGETPYAETYGDRQDLNLPSDQVTLIKKMKGYGAPVVLILVSGRPLILAPVLHYCDAIFAVWLPGTEGDGVSDILFGDFQPIGVLSRTWPKSNSQIPMNFGDSSYSPLYSYGFGIKSFADAPSGSPPACLSSIVTSDGANMELTFNKPMKDPSSESYEFIVVRNRHTMSSSLTASLKAHDSTTIMLVFDEASFATRDTVSISYSGGTIESADGGTLQSFTNFDVYNWSSISSAVRNGGDDRIPLTDRLEQNYPNPFNPSTVINYQLSSTGHVSLKVYDVLGREVVTLVNETERPGAYEVRLDGSRFSSGVYFYRLIAPGISQVRKMLLTK